MSKAEEYANIDELNQFTRTILSEVKLKTEDFIEKNPHFQPKTREDVSPKLEGRSILLIVEYTLTLLLDD